MGGVTVLGDAESFSTSETLTGGTWIDGRPVYKKTYDESVSFTAGAFNTLAHGIDGLDIIVHPARGWFQHGTEPKRSLPTTGDEAGTSIMGMIDWDATNMRGFVGSAYTGALAVSRVVFTIEYVKT